MKESPDKNLPGSLLSCLLVSCFVVAAKSKLEGRSFTAVVAVYPGRCRRCRRCSPRGRDRQRAMRD